VFSIVSSGDGSTLESDTAVVARHRYRGLLAAVNSINGSSLELPTVIYFDNPTLALF